MSETNISWTHTRNADGSITKGVTWNPVTGCSHVSAGCANCYAEALSLRHGWSKKPWTARNAAVNVRLRSDRLEDPLRWRRPRMVFVNSMSDLFHELVPDTFIAQVFSVMASAYQHTFQVLTKRPERMRDLLSAVAFWQMASDHFGGGLLVSAPLSNVWLGVSCEDQQTADERIPLLRVTPAAVRFLSCEPLLGPINLLSALGLYGLRGILSDDPAAAARENIREAVDWVIAGGESGPDFRAMDIEWFRSIHDQCKAASVPFFAKQDSGSRPGKQGRIPDELWVQEFPEPQAAPA